MKKLSKVQPMPYRYVKTWFENKFPYYNEQPTFDADGFVIDPVNAVNEAVMMREVLIGQQNRMTMADIISVEGKVA